MANPPNLSYCKIVGNFQAFIADSSESAGDLDDLPDFVPMSGLGTLTPNIYIAKNTDVANKSTLFNAPIPVFVDEDGDLSQGDNKYVMVLTPSTPIIPENFTYTIELNLTIQGRSDVRLYGPFSFVVVPGGTVNLTDIMPVPTATGNVITQGPVGPAGLQGPVGPQGPSIPVKGSVATSANLPASGNILGDGWIATNTGNLWMYNGTSFQDLGPVRGPKGDTGLQGTQGAQGPKGDIGATGIQGLKGDKGNKGDMGTSINVKGSVPSVGSLPISGVSESDAWIATDTGILYVYNGVSFISTGPVQGAKGVTGDVGPKGDTGVVGPLGPIGPAGPEGAIGQIGPKGPFGETPNISIGTVDVGTRNPVVGPIASVSIDPNSTPENPILNFVVPQGDPGGWVAPATLALGADLKDIIIDGAYQFNSNAVVSDLSTFGSLFGILYVSTAENGYRVVQTLKSTEKNSRVFWERQKYGDVWETWRAFNSTRVDETAGRAIYQWDELNNREQLIYGDTGWRDISTLLINGHTGFVKVRRINHTVHVAIDITPNMSSLGLPVLNWPTGFVPDYVAYIATRPSSAEDVIYVYIHNPGGMHVNAFNSAAWGKVTFGFSFSTVTSWPTTLPGAPEGTIPNL